jgi:hypothetical protein
LTSRTVSGQLQTGSTTEPDAAVAHDLRPHHAAHEPADEHARGLGVAVGLAALAMLGERGEVDPHRDRRRAPPDSGILDIEDVGRRPLTLEHAF